MANVTKNNLAKMIARSSGMTQVDILIVMEAFLEALSGAMREGNNIEIRGFGRFKIKKQKARMARNPRTNEPVHVPAGYKLVFQASREMKKRINALCQENVLPQESFHAE
jgi:DNA-binding protein HU-beta/integration host factor subunit beta